MVYRIDDVTAVSSPPPVPSDNIGQPGFFTGGSTSGQSATRVRFWWLNMVQEELIAFAEAAGLGPDKKNNAQALAGARILFSAAERGVAPYSAALAKLIGGYPKYAVVVDVTGAFLVSQSDKNMTVPSVDGSAWVPLLNSYARQSDLPLPVGMHVQIFKVLIPKGTSAGIGDSQFIASLPQAFSTFSFATGGDGGTLVLTVSATPQGNDKVGIWVSSAASQSGPLPGDAIVTIVAYGYP